MCVASARSGTPPFIRDYFGRGRGIARALCCEMHAKGEGSLAHHHGFLVASTIREERCAERRTGLGGYSHHVLMELGNILSEKFCQSWWGMPQVAASFTFYHQIHEKGALKGTRNSATIVARLKHVENLNIPLDTASPRPVCQSDNKRSEQHAI